MKAGDYVRTKRGTFDRFITSHTQDNLTWYTFEDRGNITNPENYIIKSSSNIIDLIEVGDIVKIEYQGWHQVSTKFETLKFFDDEGTEYLYDEIRAIITREQLESMEYKVGE